MSQREMEASKKKCARTSFDANIFAKICQQPMDDDFLHQALDLHLYAHGRFEAINTSQNIGRMNPIYGTQELCYLTSGPQKL